MRNAQLRRLAVGASTLVLFGVHAVAGVNTWTPVGPDGGAVRAVAFHPTQPGVVFAAAGYAVYRSADSGQSWTVAGAGIPNGTTRIIFDPTNGNRVMTSGGSTIFRSDDGGLTFAAALGPTAHQTIFTIAIAADRSVYAATFPGKVFRGADFGSTWEDRSQGLPASDYVRYLVADPQNPSVLYALPTSGGLYRSTDAGLTWNLHNALANLAAFNVAIDPGDSTRLLLATYLGLYASQDGGMTWVFDQSGNFVWVGYHPSAVGAAVAIRDQGRTLRRASRTDPWLEGEFLKVRGESGSFDPHNSDVANSTLMVATPEGPLYTQDSGATYEVRSQGIRSSTAMALTAASDGTIYAAFESGPIGVLQRTPTGWVPVDNAELRTEVPYAFQPRGLAVAPDNGATLFVSSGTSVVRSLDGGQSWSPPHPTFATLVLYPRVIRFAPSNSQVVYVGTDQGGLYRSENQGITWAPRNTGLPMSIGSIAVDPTNADIAYAASHYVQGGAALLKTTDGGLNWTPASTGLNVQTIGSLVTTPGDGEVLYTGGFGNEQGLYKSANAGASWTRVGAPIGNAPALSIAVDPIVNSNIVMTMNATASGSARSVDAGATWEDLTFPPPLGSFSNLIREVVLDPLRPHVIIGSAYDYSLVEFEVSPDLEVTVPSAPATLPLGGSGVATVRVANRGPFAASAVELTLRLPAGTAAPIPMPDQGTCVLVITTLQCSLGAVRVNQQVDTLITLTGGNIPTAGLLLASVTGHESDPVLANNSRNAAVATERIANLGLTLVSNAAAVDHRSAVTLTAEAVNGGPNESAAAQVMLALAAGLTFQSAAASQGACTENAGTVTCALGSLNPTAQATVTVNAVADGIDDLTASATVTDTGLDPNTANNTATATVTSRRVADVGLQLSDLADPVISGQALQYTATVMNSGPDDLPAATVTINVSGASVTSASSGQGSCSVGGTTVTCTLNLASGGNGMISVQATAGAPGTASANASSAFQGTDPSAANNTAAQSTTINAPPSSGGGGGGGGSAGLLDLAILLAFALLGRRAIAATQLRPRRSRF